MDVTQQYGLGRSPGSYFGAGDAHLLIPIKDDETGFWTYDSSGSANACNVVAFFTNFAAYCGVTDTTNWTADTYKTIFEDASGKGRFAGFLGPKAGGASTTTVRVTIDGITEEKSFANVNTHRVWFGMYIPPQGIEFTTASDFPKPGAETLDAGKTGYTSTKAQTARILSWTAIHLLGIPVLRYKRSLLIEAKHSASIINSTATAYSAVQVLVGE